MDLELQVSIVPKDRSLPSAGDKPTQASLFDAVRRWTDEEGVDAFDIQIDGKKLSSEQIQEIAHSDGYKNRLLAFDGRR